MRLSPLLLFFVLTLAAVPGILPFAIFIESRNFFFAYIVVSAVLAAVVSARRVFREAPIPRPSAYLQGFAAMGAMHAGAGAYGFAMYGVAYGLAWLTLWVIDWGGWSIGPFDPNAPATAVSMFFSLVMGATVALGNIPKALHEPGLGAGGPFQSLTPRHHAGVIAGLIGGVLLSIGLAVLGIPDLWQLAASFLIAAGGMTALNKSLTWSAGATFDRDAAMAVGRLYEALDYKTIMRPTPKHDDEKLGWLLQRLNLIASRGQEILAVVVLTPISGHRPAVPADVSLLPAVARQLSRSLVEDEEHPVKVQPVVLLIDREATPQLVNFAQEERIQLVQSLTHEDIRKALATSDVADLRPQAQQHLQPDSRTVVFDAAQSPAQSQPQAGA